MDLYLAAWENFAKAGPDDLQSSQIGIADYPMPPIARSMKWNSGFTRTTFNEGMINILRTQHPIFAILLGIGIVDRSNFSVVW
jgi:hypothetical protein